MHKFFKSFYYAYKGFKFGWQEERNFRIEIIIGILVILLAWALCFSALEWALVVFAIALVLSAELINTVVEDVLDTLEKKHSHEVGRIKDISAAMVLVMSLGAFFVGLLVFIGHFLR